MNKLISFRNKIESLYLKNSRVLGYIARMLITFACLMILRSSINFNLVLSNIWVVIGLSIVCGFIPLRFLMAVILAYIVAQVFTLSTALGIVFLIILALMYLLFFRYAPTYGPALVLIPLMFLIRLQVLVPIILAIVGPAISVIVVIIVLGVLLITTEAYAEIPVLLITFGGAAVLQMGSNFVFGTISYVSNSVTIVLQLALSIDYAIIYLNRYKEEHQQKERNVCL